MCVYALNFSRPELPLIMEMLLDVYVLLVLVSGCVCTVNANTTVAPESQQPPVLCTDTFTTIEELADTCSGDTAFSTTYSHISGRYIIVQPGQCCTYCKAGQSIRLHPSFLSLSSYQCYNVSLHTTLIPDISDIETFYDLVYAHTNFINSLPKTFSINTWVDRATLNSSSVYFLDTAPKGFTRNGYYMNSIINKLMPVTGCTESSFVASSARMYSDTECGINLQCNQFTQWKNITDNTCNAKSPVNPATEMIIDFGSETTDLHKIPKTNCTAYGKYFRYDAGMWKDHTCIQPTSCTGAYYVLQPMTTTTDNVCGVKLACGPGTYYDKNAHRDRQQGENSDVEESCISCPVGTYQSANLHFNESCVTRDLIGACEVNKTYMAYYVEQMDLVTATKAYCKTVHIPTGYEIIGYINGVPQLQLINLVLSSNTQDDVHFSFFGLGDPPAPAPAPVCPPPAPGVQYYKRRITQERDGIQCLTCTKCHGLQSYTITPCQEWQDTVCGESPQIEALYAFGLAAYLFYMVSAFFLYIYFFKRHYTQDTHN